MLPVPNGHYLVVGTSFPNMLDIAKSLIEKEHNTK
jgi:hypothetical protein